MSRSGAGTSAPASIAESKRSGVTTRLIFLTKLDIFQPVLQWGDDQTHVSALFLCRPPFPCAARIALPLPPQLLRRLWAYVMTLCLEASLSIRKASVDDW